MKKKIKILSTLASLVLAMSLLAFGVYSATAVSFNIRNTINNVNCWSVFHKCMSKINTCWVTKNINFSIWITIFECKVSYISIAICTIRNISTMTSNIFYCLYIGKKHFLAKNKELILLYPKSESLKDQGGELFEKEYRNY